MPVSWSCDVPDVLEKNYGWLTLLQDSADVPEEGSSGFIHSLLKPGLAEWLTRETCSENVMVGDVHPLRSQWDDVTLNQGSSRGWLNRLSPVQAIHVRSSFVDLGDEGTLATRGAQGGMKTPDTSEKIHEPE